MKIQADNARCSGCKLCQLSCALANHNQNNPKMTAIKVWSEHFTTGTYRVAVCDQCGECAKICPTGAITMQDGVYSINPETCINCRVCVQVCPSEVMYVHRGLSTPLKCTCCEACVQICPTHTLSLAE